MTLVVGKVFEKSVCMVSDTKLTHHRLNRPPLKVTEGWVKTKILTPSLAISFAGECVFAAETIRRINPQMSLGEVEQILFSAHLSRDMENGAEFLIASKFEHPALCQIKDGVKRDVKIGWIGSHQGFR